ncbi:50S ribosomal protein L19 [Moraxella catarrhalis]|uniref:50S ribosomal protein L19 n=1 Tax=Moraxella catarrhalis TaxID=480 RepID=UPI001374C81D|nr:50S ribosomal protein L19 [Moraxella catarrhalis]
MAKIINQSSHVYRLFKLSSKRQASSVKRQASSVKRQASSVKRQASSVNDYLHMTQPVNPLTP